MISHYTTIAAQLEADIKEALGARSVYFGQPRVNPAFPTATVRTSLQRETIGRQIHLQWEFQIEGWFEPPQGVMLETFLVEKADALIMKLAPYSEDGPAASLEPYAETAGSRAVEKVELLDMDESGKFCAVSLTFTCLSVVYQ